jgi:hypothetical protein
MVSQVESCYTTTSTYAECEDGSPSLDKGGITATVANSNGASGYTVEATSETGNKFKITKSVSGVSRTCTTTGGSTKGGCKTNNGSW